MLLKNLVVPAGFIDTARDEHGVPAAARQTILLEEVVQNIEDDLLKARLRAQEALHRAPALLELIPGDVCEALGALFEPCVNLFLRDDALIYAPGLVA